MFKINVWWLAIRPKTLWVSISPVIVGSSFALNQLQDSFSYLISAITLFAALLIQILSNLINDLYDFKKGVDNINRLGPLRVMQGNLISEKEMKNFIMFVLFATVLLGLFLVIKGGSVILLIGLASIISAFIYTAGPYPLAYNGLGEVFVFIFFGVLAVEGTYFLQYKIFSFKILYYSFSIGSLASAILVVNNLRDIENDRIMNKKTLAVRFGERFSRLEFSVLICLAYFFSLPLIFDYFATIIIFFSLPFAMYLIYYANNEKGEQLNWLLENTSKLLIIYSLLLSAGLIIDV